MTLHGLLNSISASWLHCGTRVKDTLRLTSAVVAKPPLTAFQFFGLRGAYPKGRLAGDNAISIYFLPLESWNTGKEYRLNMTKLQ